MEEYDYVYPSALSKSVRALHSLDHYPLLETLELSRRWFSPQHEVHIHSVLKLTELSPSSNDSQCPYLTDFRRAYRHCSFTMCACASRFTTMAGGGSRIRELVLRNLPLSIANLSAFPFAFPLLEELRCMSVSIYGTANGGVEFVVWTLSTLGLGNWAKGLLRYITAPALEYLTIEEESTVNEPSNWEEVEVEVEKVAIREFDWVFLFLSRSEAPIQSFSFSSDTREEIALVPLLQKMPGLVSINLKVVASQRSIE